MTTPSSRTQERSLFTITFGMCAVMFFFLASGFISYWNTRVLLQNVEWVTHTHEVLNSLDKVMLSMTDAETSQRAYIITDNDRYLEPYHEAVRQVPVFIQKVELLTRDNANQQRRLPILKAHVDARLQLLAENVELRRSKGLDATRIAIIGNQGKNEMDIVRSTMVEMMDEERSLRTARISEMKDAYYTTIVSGLLMAGLGIILSFVVAHLLKRAQSARQRQEWLQAGQVGLAEAIFGEKRVEEMTADVLRFVAEYSGAQVAAMFVRDGDRFRRTTAYGVPDDAGLAQVFAMGEGLLGQAAKDNRTFMLDDVPEGYLAIGTALGQTVPRHLIVSPAEADGVVNAVIELGFLHPVSDAVIEFMEHTSEPVAIAIRSAEYRLHLQNLLEETQRQAEELQSQSEELRVNNEELEEQSTALKESQSRLEQQQMELEQTNSQLEEQTQQLEAQRDDLVRASASIELKARELQQASQYKSDFLANMSHELRTPLNSSLILAKLLADNSHGNLTAEQVKFAQTIQSSGNDLLMLINDILDLSKIEAGHMEIRPEPVPLDILVRDMKRVFEPLASEKGLSFEVSVGSDMPKSIETDRMRLEQILKNLLSNGIKFTEKGKVSLSIQRTKGGAMAFAVTDTGIGIPADHQQAVFDAFRQADGTISRKYGGTGLGLSISRELSRLLGGTITLKSEHGRGSVFTLIIPEAYDAEHVPERVTNITATTLPPLAPSSARAQERPHWIPDDRAELKAGERTILVIEDDGSFARILYDLVHEMDLQCLITNTADEAIIMARQYMPSAVLLDVGLPDHSGLSVLDRLKRDPRTRHIPVHVISAGDHAQTALSLGAVGYMLKPVKRDELMDSLRKLEMRFSQGMRRVLIVEDDPVQQESMKKLLATGGVETVAVGTARECLGLLKDNTFDCMVLDLSLPDASGYSLLETLSREEAYSFPPVIVYTGRDLSVNEEQRLRRYSKSIIIKGARSPERLLDEVTLFLHQVVAELPAEQQRMLEKARDRDAVLEERQILVVEDDVRNVYALTNILEPRGAQVHIARNGLEALKALEQNEGIELVLMDVMMPEMDGLTATREIRKRAEWKKLPIIMLTAKAMRDDQERCLDAGANDYMAKPLDVEKLLSLVRVWMPR